MTHRPNLAGLNGFYIFQWLKRKGYFVTWKWYKNWNFSVHSFLNTACTFVKVLFMTTFAVYQELIAQLWQTIWPAKSKIFTILTLYRTLRTFVFDCGSTSAGRLGSCTHPEILAHTTLGINEKIVLAFGWQFSLCSFSLLLLSISSRGRAHLCTLSSKTFQPVCQESVPIVYSKSVPEQ